MMGCWDAAMMNKDVLAEFKEEDAQSMTAESIKAHSTHNKSKRIKTGSIRGQNASLHRKTY